MSASEEKILEFIRLGVFSVDPSGVIWRHKNITRSGKFIPIEPVRADRVRPDGYSFIRVQINRQEYFAMAHRIIWMDAFGFIPEGMEINHKNGKRSSNNLNNLEVVTPGQNLTHSYHVLGRVRLTGERNGRNKLTSNQVKEIREKHSIGFSQRGLAREFGVPTQWFNAYSMGVYGRMKCPKSKS